MMNECTAIRSKRQWVCLPVDEAKARALQSALGIDPILCRLLVQRGVEDFEGARRFFRPSLEALHDPFLMAGMEAAVDRLHLAISRQERILIFGDYDVDGTSAVALMYQFIQALGGAVHFYLPDRHQEGYGLSAEGLDFAHQRGVSLVLVLDCGIRNVREAEQAGRLGIDLIIGDHHLPGGMLPKASAILNPWQADCSYPYPFLSGCGIAFKLVQAYCLRYAPSGLTPETLLDLVAISIASDIVPITGENRLLAFFGLQRLNQLPRPGIKKLIEKSGRRPPLSISDLVFGLGPMINAAGRLADADQAVLLFLSETVAEAEAYASVLAYRNQMRRELDQRLIKEAQGMIQSEGGWENRNSLVMYQPHWHQGVLGIAASRLAEQYFRPTILLARSEADKLVGSARSVAGFDLHEALGACSDLLLSYGGHPHAAGLKLRPKDLGDFQGRFEEVVQMNLQGRELAPQLAYSADLPLAALNMRFWRILQQFAPFGPGNENPVFRARPLRASSIQLLKGGHIRFALEQEGRVFPAIAFHRADLYSLLQSGEPLDACFSLGEDRFREGSCVQFQVKDLRPAQA